MQKPDSVGQSGLSKATDWMAAVSFQPNLPTLLGTSAQMGNRQKLSTMPKEQHSRESLQTVLSHLDENRGEVVFYYQLMIIFFVLVVASQLGLGTWFVWNQTDRSSGSSVYPFLTVNVAATVVELLLVRIGFMLASRAGQIRDLMCALKIADSEMNVERLNLAVQPFNTTRRTAQELKVLDIESMANGAIGKVQAKTTP